MEIEERKWDKSVCKCCKVAQGSRISTFNFQHENGKALVKYIIKGWEDTLAAEIRDREDVVV